MTVSAADHRVRHYVYAGVALALMLAALFPRTFFLGEVLLPAGLLFEYPPWSEYTEFVEGGIPAAENYLAIESFLMFNMFYAATDLALAQGEWPLWNPLEFGGMPLLANYQSAVLYPPRLLHAVFDRYVATTLFVILKLWLCGFNAFICARAFGLRPTTAMIPAAAWMLSGYNTTWAYWADPDVAAWLPLQVASAELLARRCVRRGGALMAFSSTLMLLGGHPESAFTMSAGTGLFFFTRIATLGRAAVGPIVTAGFAWAFAIAITAPQTIPFLEYLPESQTFASRGTETSHDLHFLPGSAWICFFVPRFFGTDTDRNFWTTAAENQNYLIMAYAGVAVWVLTACGLVGCTRRRYRLLVSLMIPAVLSIGLATDVSMLRFVHRLPLLDSIWGCWFLGFPLFVLALLAGFGWESVIDRTISRRSLQVLALLFFALLPVCLGMYAFYRPVLEVEEVLPYAHLQLGAAVIVAVAIIALLVLSWAQRGRRGFALAVIALVAGDLIWAARDLHPSAPHKFVLFETNLTNVLKQQPDRVHATAAGIPTGLLQGYGIEQLWGYDGIMPAGWWRFLAETDTALVERMTGVRYVLAPPDGEPKGLPIDGVALHERADALPRAFLARSVVQVGDASAVFERMRTPDFDPEREVLTTAAVAQIPGTQSGDLGNTKLVSRTSNAVVVDVEASRPCALVLSDAYYPGWQARIDGEPVEIFPAYHAFRGVVIPAGAHRVEFEYQPGSFHVGLMFSLAAMAVSIVGCAVIIARRRLA